MIYVHRGDGTSNGMNQGVTLDQAGQWLMGSGSAFIFDATQFQTPGANFANGSVIAPAGLAPVITNTQVAGDGILMTASATGVAGVTIQGAQGNGIYALANAGQIFERVTIRDVTASGNNANGVNVAADGAVISDVTMSNLEANSNGVIGVYLAPYSGGMINQATLDNITTNNNSVHGLALDVSTDGIFASVIATNVTAQGIIPQASL